MSDETTPKRESGVKEIKTALTVVPEVIYSDLDGKFYPQTRIILPEGKIEVQRSKIPCDDLESALKQSRTLTDLAALHAEMVLLTRKVETTEIYLDEKHGFIDRSAD